MRNEAAKLTLERREMREEMARMRKELQTLREGGAAGAGAASSTQSLEERLGKLQQLLDKGLISADDFKQRKRAILEEI
jgi:membrane protease subunit (stomatin/prohibitin family)